MIEHAYVHSHLIYLFTAKWRPRVKKTCAPEKRQFKLLSQISNVMKIIQIHIHKLAKHKTF
jgi:hypothetical protein